MVFGKVVEGYEIVKTIEGVGSSSGSTSKKVENLQIRSLVDVDSYIYIYDTCMSI